ncbi:MAG: xylosidase/arabinosidase [Akkermansiaceae bacterium]|nr:xylosidase/arabinosidase [Akkermansiaceae bacterium]
MALAIWVGVPAVAAEEVAWRPYEGPSAAGTDVSTLKGKIVCGYQGWFACDGDGSDLGWVHWARNPREALGPGNVTVDLWPDVSELSEPERFATAFRHADGRTAEVFSSANRSTVLRHFEWMRDHGIDGAFVQRFANGLRNERLLRQKNAVLRHAREAANRAGRSYAVMYDLSGLGAGEVARVREDWIVLRREGRIGDDPAHQRHEGKPLVAIWGVGFSDDRRYSLEECRDLVTFLKSDGCAVMLGVPSWWREGARDAVGDPRLLETIALADIVSPWTVGRYRTPDQAARHGEQVWAPDVAWCRERGLDFLPVAFPGFSWHNLAGNAPLDAIPRLGGRFLWSQFVASKRAGAETVYVAMFDEVDEGTAIFKCTNDVPAGGGVSFLGFEGLPPDHYLRLTGEGGRLLRGEIPVTEEMPVNFGPNAATQQGKVGDPTLLGSHTPPAGDNLRSVSESR